MTRKQIYPTHCRKCNYYLKNKNAGYYHTHDGEEICIKRQEEYERMKQKKEEDAKREKEGEDKEKSPGIVAEVVSSIVMSDAEMEVMRLKAYIERMNLEKNENNTNPYVDAQEEYVYLTQTSHSIDVGESVFKVGRTTNWQKRASSYPKGIQLLFLARCKDTKDMEAIILSKFRAAFEEQKHYGSEYFRGDFFEMRDVIYECIKMEGK